MDKFEIRKFAEKECLASVKIGNLNFIAVCSQFFVEYDGT